MRLSSLLPLAFFCAASTAHADTKGEDMRWPQQPASFMGVSLDKAITSQLSQCHLDSSPNNLCYQSPYRGYYPLSGLPQIGIYGYRLSVMTYESKIRQITLDTDSDDYKTLKSMLLQKYGKPKLEGSGAVTTNAGVTFENEKLLWEGDKVMIILKKYSDTIDESSVLVINKSVADHAKEAERSKLLENASKI